MMCYNRAMKNASSYAVFLPICCFFLTLGCGPHHPPADPAYLAEIEDWHSERLSKLEAEDGWLSLAGLFWLEVGENRLGTLAQNEIVLPAGSAPELAAVISLAEDHTATIHAESGVTLTIKGKTITEGILTTDEHTAPDIVELGRLRFYIIKRGDRLGVRVKDPKAKTRVGFKGIDRFPVDPAFKINARFEAYPEPRELTIATAIGTEDKVLAPGKLLFTVNGQEFSLEPFADSIDDNFFIVFRDATSGHTTYGAGRFVETSPPNEGSVVLDFNTAYNPPCAFTPYATCPLAPTGNQLAIEITAGEKYTGH